jgi:hypothetical protein
MRPARTAPRRWKSRSIFAAQPPSTHFDWKSADGSVFRLHLPLGRDMHSWHRREGMPARHELAVSLVEAIADVQPADHASMVQDWLAAIEDAFESHDPLTALHLRADCPACGHGNDIDCDLEALLLAGFARLQSRLLDEVARLATSFHWSEAEIAALPRWRREQYLRRLDGGASL